MAITNVVITDKIVGDSFQLIRNVSGVPQGETLTKAWFTIKRGYGDIDVNAALQKIITTADVAGVGAITNGPGQTAVLRFDVRPVDWTNIQSRMEYIYDIQVMASGGGIYTVEVGKFQAQPGVTSAIS